MKLSQLSAFVFEAVDTANALADLVVAWVKHIRAVRRSAGHSLRPA